MIAPTLRRLAEEQTWDVSALDFYVIHAGGPRILDDLSSLLGVPADAFRHSRGVLSDFGNIASVVVLAVLKRFFEEDDMSTGARGMLAGFGPGITAEVSLGTWTAPPERPDSDSIRERITLPVTAPAFAR